MTASIILLLKITGELSFGVVSLGLIGSLVFPEGRINRHCESWLFIHWDHMYLSGSISVFGLHGIKFCHQGGVAA